MDIIWHNPYHLNGPIKFELLNGEEILAKLEPLDDSGAINDKKLVIPLPLSLPLYLPIPSIHFWELNSNLAARQKLFCCQISNANPVFFD